MGKALEWKKKIAKYHWKLNVSIHQKRKDLHFEKDILMPKRWSLNLKGREQTFKYA